MPFKTKSMESRHTTAGIIFWAMALLFYAQSLPAQHGFPLEGNWSGEKMTEDGQAIRVLLILDFSVDQVISGTIIENGRRRIPLSSVRLDHNTWTVSMVGEPDSGDNYQIQGTIENLGSPTERTIAGTWWEGDESGNFRVVIN